MLDFKFTPTHFHARGIQIVETKLLGLSDLYKVFGEGQQMPDVLLLVLHCAGQGNSESIDHLWRSTIDSCLTDENGDPRYDLADANACVPVIREKVLYLAKTFLTSRSTAHSLESAQNTSKYIPLKIIIRYLEQMTCQFGWYESCQSWVVDMMVSMTGYRVGGKCLFNSTEWSNGQAMITVKELLDVYHQIHTEKDPFWAEQAQQQFYILGSISYSAF